jgi:hypothetical protein
MACARNLVSKAQGSPVPRWPVAALSEGKEPQAIQLWKGCTLLIQSKDGSPKSFGTSEPRNKVAS